VSPPNAFLLTSYTDFFYAITATGNYAVNIAIDCYCRATASVVNR